MNFSIISNFNRLLIPVILVILAGCSSYHPVKTTSSWETFLHDGARTNSSSDEVELPVRLMWDKKISPFELFKGYPKEQLSSPVIHGNVLYIGSTDKTFYAFDLGSGKRLWESGSGGFIESIATVSDGHVYFGSSDGLLRALNAADGKELWRFNTNSEIISSPLVRSSILYLYSSGNRVYAVDIKTGEKLWRYTHPVFQTISMRSHSSPASSTDGKMIYQVFSDGTLSALDSGTGRAVWSKKLFTGAPPAGQYRRTPVVNGDTVFAIGESLKVHAFDAASGRLKNRYGKAAARDFIVSDKDKVIIAGEKSVLAVSIATGHEQWESAVEVGSVLSMMRAGKKIFLLSNSVTKLLGLNFLTSRKGFLQAIDMADGRTLFKKRLSSSISAGSSSAGGVLALFTDRGVIEVWAAKGSR